MRLRHWRASRCWRCTSHRHAGPESVLSRSKHPNVLGAVSDGASLRRSRACFNGLEDWEIDNEKRARRPVFAMFLAERASASRAS